MSTDRKIVASIDVWRQVSSDYQSSKSRMVKVFSPNDTIGDVMAWVKDTTAKVLGWSDLVLAKDQEV